MNIRLQKSRSRYTLSELVSYYKDVFSLLSSCAARQLDEITFRRRLSGLQIWLHRPHLFESSAEEKIVYAATGRKYR